MAASIVISILGDSRNLTRTLGQTENKLGGFGKAAKVAGGIAAGALAAGVGVAGTALVKGFQRLQGIDEAKSKLTGLGHSADSVAAIMTNATDAVTGTAFGLDAAATVAASTVAAGVKPGKELERTLTLVGDAATIAGTDMNAMGAIFNKVAASDMIQGDVIAQLGDRGIPILQFLGKELGVTAQEAKKMASAGKVDFATFQSAMEAGLGGAAQESGKTFAGAMANMNAALGRLGARVLDGAFQQMPALFASAGASLDKLAPVADRIGAALGRGMVLAGDAVRSLLPHVQRVLGYLKGDGVSGVSAFVTQIGQNLIPIARNLADLFTGTILPTLQNVAGYLVGSLGPIFTGVFGLIQTHVVPIITEVATFLTGTLYPAVWGIVESVGAHLRPVFDAVVETIQSSVMPAVENLLGKFREWQPTIQRVVKVVVSVTGTVLKFAAAIVGKVLPPVIRFAGFLLKNVVGAVSTVVGVVVGAVGKVIDFGAAFGRAAAAVGRGIGRVVKFVREVPRKVLKVITDLGEDLLEAGKKLMGKLGDGIKAGVSAPWNAMKNGAGKLKRLWPGSPVKEGPLTSFNNGRTGKTLMAMLAKGITDSNDPLDAMRTVAGDLDREARRAITPSTTRPRPAIAGAGYGHGPAGGGAHVVRVELTAEELHRLERGRRVALDLRSYAAAGGALA